MTKEEKLRRINPMAYPGSKDANHKLPIEMVWDEVCDYFEIESELLKTKSNKREIIVVRHCFFYLAKKWSAATYCRIGEVASDDTFNYNHSTVWTAVKKVENIMHYQEQYRYPVEDINKRLRAKSSGAE